MSRTGIIARGFELLRKARQMGLFDAPAGAGGGGGGGGAKKPPKPAAKPKQTGGPYIGPRGGKWADPQHKIPWKEEAPKKAPKEQAEKVEAPPVSAHRMKMEYKGLRTWVTQGGHGTSKEELEQRLAAALETQKQSEIFSFTVKHVKREKASKKDGRPIPAYDEWNVEIEHRAAIPGHSLTGKIETASGVVTMFHKDATVSREDYNRAQQGVCDVCKTKRKRSSVFVVEREADKKHLLVGGECAKKFKGADLQKLARAFEEVDLSGVVNDAFDDGEEGGAGRVRIVAEPHDLLGTSLWLVREQGYISRADAEAQNTLSTADRVDEIILQIMVGGKNAPSGGQQKEIDKAIEEVKKDLPKMLDWIQERIPDDPDAPITQDIAFAVTVHKLLSSDFIHDKHFSRVVWVPHRYYKMVARREAQEKAKAYKAPHAKMHNLAGEWTILSNTVKESDYGSYNSVTAMDAEGHKIWFRQTHAEDLREGDKVTLRGKLKAEKDNITFMSHMKVKNISSEAREATEEAAAKEFQAEEDRKIASNDPADTVQVEVGKLYDPSNSPEGIARQDAFRAKQVKAVVTLAKKGTEIPETALQTAIDHYDGYKAREPNPELGSALRQYRTLQRGEHPIHVDEFLRQFPKIGEKMIRDKLTKDQSEYLFRHLAKKSQRSARIVGEENPMIPLRKTMTTKEGKELSFKQLEGKIRTSGGAGDPAAVAAKVYREAGGVPGKKKKKKGKGRMTCKSALIERGLELMKAGEGTRGGKVIGHTASGKPIYATHEVMRGTGRYNADHKLYSKHGFLDHLDAETQHRKKAKTAMKKEKFAEASIHDEAADSHAAQAAKIHKKKYGEKSDTDSSSLLKGYYPRDNITEWSNQFYNTPHAVEALKLLKTKAALKREEEEMERRHKDYSELEEMPRSKRDQIRQSQRKESDALDSKREALTAKMCTLEEKLIDHRIQEEEVRLRMGKGDQSPTLEKGLVCRIDRNGYFINRNKCDEVLPLLKSTEGMEVPTDYNPGAPVQKWGSSTIEMTPDIVDGMALINYPGATPADQRAKVAGLFDDGELVEVDEKGNIPGVKGPFGSSY